MFSAPKSRLVLFLALFMLALGWFFCVHKPPASALAYIQKKSVAPVNPALLLLGDDSGSQRSFAAINQLLLNHDCTHAIPMLRAFVQNTDTSSQARLVLAQCLIQQGQGAEAQALLLTLSKDGVSDSVLGKWRSKAKVLAREDEEMGRMQSAHFDLWVEGKIKTWKASDTLLTALEAIYDRMCLEFSYYPTQKIQAVLYESGRFQSRPLPDWTGALYDGKVRIPYNVMQDWPLHQKILAHEVAHAFVHDLAQVPLDSWFDEGVAQHLDGTVWNPGEMPPAQISPPESITGNNFLDHADADDARRLYFTSLGMFEVLMQNCFEGDFSQIKPMLLDLRSGTTLAQSLQSHCGLSLDDLWSKTRARMDLAISTQGKHVPEPIDPRSSSSP